ncbi:MAG: fumarylacetoacetate hydrolase family protein [Burkholderiaceae bacterium]|nr:fumarylacetoacetate hydrolase family protein [Burkholderiaceae bacterium]
MDRTDAADQAAVDLSTCWKTGQHRDHLPVDLRPQSREQGYAIQAFWAHELGQEIAGWKIAATSLAGQRHIGVDGPLAGPIFAENVQPDGAEISLQDNRMRVAEGEIVFMIGQTLPPRSTPYTRDEVLAAIESVHPGIEVPDSRFLSFEDAGAAQLIADCACSNDMVLGAAATTLEPLEGLFGLQTKASVSDGRQFVGSGANVLGDPIVALCWLVNELSVNQVPLKQGQFVTTGACIQPIPVSPGDEVSVDLGWVGRISARFV